MSCCGWLAPACYQFALHVVTSSPNFQHHLFDEDLHYATILCDKALKSDKFLNCGNSQQQSVSVDFWLKLKNFNFSQYITSSVALPQTNYVFQFHFFCYCKQTPALCPASNTKASSTVVVQKGYCQMFVVFLALLMHVTNRQHKMRHSTKVEYSKSFVMLILCALYNTFTMLWFSLNSLFSPLCKHLNLFFSPWIYL